MSFYDPKTQSLIVQVPAKKGGTRKPTIKDAKENGWFVRVTQITGDFTSDGLIKYKVGCGVRTALENEQKDREPLDSYVDRMVVLSRRDASDAASKGTDIHNAIELFEQTGEGSADPVIAKHLRAWRKWRACIKEVLSMEQIGFGPGYAGKYDMDCVLEDGRTCLPDIKSQRFDSSPSTYESWGLQLAAYETFHKTQRDVWVNVCLSTTNPGLLVAHEWTQEGMNYYRARWPLEFFRYCFAHRYFPPNAFEYFLESLSKKDQLLEAMKYVGEGRKQKTKVVA